ncbi:MAG: hypothetical protein ACOZQL_41115 [Myxococcota bacterium]
MSDDRIDFSALDPSRQPARWEALVQRTLAAAAPPEPAWLSVRHLRVPALALAAVALLSWLPALFGEPPTRAPGDRAVALLQYSSAGDVTSLLESVDEW